MSALENLGRIPRPVIYLLTIVILIVPLFFPWNFPISVSDEISLMFEDIDALQPGDTIVFQHMMSAGFWGEQQHQAYALLQHLFLLDGVKFILVPMRSVDTMALMHRTMDIIENPLDKQYGIDYVALQYLPALEPGAMSIAEDFKGTYTTDEYGTPIEELPLMDDINEVGDIKIWVWMEFARYQVITPRFIYPKWTEVTYFGICGGEGFMFMAPYMGNIYKSGMTGTRGAAEYQGLCRDRYGSKVTGAVAQMDALSGYHLLGIILVILGNIAYFAARSKRTGGP